MYLSSYGAIISTFWVKPCSTKFMSADRIRQELELKEYELTKRRCGFFSEFIKLYSVSYYCYVKCA